MIETAIKEIREAELKAEQMQKDAYRQGKQIVLDAEADAEKQKKLTMQECKEQRNAALDEARRKADERSAQILAKGEEEAAKLIEDTQAAADSAAEGVVAALLAAYGAGEDIEQ